MLWEAGDMGKGDNASGVIDGAELSKNILMNVRRFWGVLIIMGKRMDL